MDSGRTTVPGSGLQPFLCERMKYLGIDKPSLRKLAELADLSPNTLRKNLAGEQEMRLSTAIRLAKVLDYTIDEFVREFDCSPGA